MIHIKDITITRRPNPAFNTIDLIGSISRSYSITSPVESLPLKFHVDRDRMMVDEITRGLCAATYHEVSKELQKITEIAIRESGDRYSFGRDTINAICDLRRKLSRPQV